MATLSVAPIKSASSLRVYMDSSKLPANGIPNSPFLSLLLVLHNPKLTTAYLLKWITTPFLLYWFMLTTLSLLVTVPLPLNHLNPSCINNFKLKILAAYDTFSTSKLLDPRHIHLCQRKYTLDILADSGALASKPLKLPLEQNFKLSKTSRVPLPDLSSYHRLIGRLLYLTITRSDICYPVQILSQYLDTPMTTHLATTHRILCYIKFAPGQGILLSSSSHIQLKAFCDSDWASCPDTRRSVTGYCIFLGNSLIS